MINNFYRTLALKQYELTNHLGDVMVVISDRKIAVDDGTYSGGVKINSTPDGITDFYQADVVQAVDRYLGGWPMPGRSFYSSDKYRYGAGGKENIDEVTGSESTVDMGDRWLDERLLRTPKPDAKGALYPGVSPYAYVLNSFPNAIDPDGKVVIFINGNHYGDGGTSAYWRQYEDYQSGTRTTYDEFGVPDKVPVYSKRETYAFDKQAMQQFGDNKARYYDGSLGGWAPFNMNSNGQTYERYQSGYMQAKTDAADIIANLKRDADGNITETIKIVSHSMGGVYSKGFVQGLNDYIAANKIEGVKIEIEVDFAPFQSNDPLNAAKDGVPTFQASHSDDPVAGNKPGKGSKQVDTGSDAGQGHSIFDFKSTVKKLGNMLKGVR